MISNMDTDNAVILDNVYVWAYEQQHWFGITGWCVPTASKPSGFNNDWIYNINYCLSLTQSYDAWSEICIDNEGSGGDNDCSPGQIMMYFDINLPDAWRYDSPWEDVSNLQNVQPISCSPTKYPT